MQNVELFAVEVQPVKGSWWRLAAVVLAGVVATALSYLALAWGGLVALSRTFEGSGHPPLPAAPDWLYVLVFLVVAPLGALAVGVFAARAANRALAKAKAGGAV